MSNETDYITLQVYNHISQQFTKYVGIFLYITCLFGTIMNMLTFSQQIYTTHACSLYLLLGSICDFIHLNLDPLSNILEYAFDYDWTINSLIYCKTKSYFAYVFTITSGTMTTFASVTQYFLSSQKSTRWYYTRRHIGVRCIISIILFWFIISIPILFCSKHFPHASHNERIICSNPAQNIYCFLVRLLYICLFNGFLPPFIMMIFGFLTHRNVRNLHRRSKYKSIRIQRINQQLTAMLILQSIKSTFASIPFSIFNCYWLNTRNTNKSLLLQAKENLIFQIVYLLFWSNYTSFFVYMYSSDMFRHQWIKALKQILCCLGGKRQQPYASRTS
jgi:hypothetical protein